MLTVKRTRRIVSVLTVLFFISIVLGSVLLFCAAGTGDYYTKELKIAVPGDIDLKIEFCSGVLLMIALGIMWIFDHYDFDFIYELDNIPLFYTVKVDEQAKNNTFFIKQINQAIDNFLNEDWGVIGEHDIDINEKSMECGVGSVLGAYHTIKGLIYIVTDSDRGKTTVMFPEEY